ncbi:hypothetical protein GL218_04253 [Daldinia childiae]|uniref:uncharacterized protein n=1 Tax=Daldinia childiae TaxID=326645 RepID=UPI0014470A87|nr:uncharacterized protein GL218_04253 [Daldinia childiae]KAF3061774.1 hypothetical protein GL218_04253 [Daldinia childiae]
MIFDSDHIFDTTGKYYFWDDQDQASLAGRALSQLSWTVIVRAAKVLEASMRAVLPPSRISSFLREHVLLEEGERPVVSRRFTIVEGSLLLARKDEDVFGWAPRGSDSDSLRNLRCIQDHLDVCLYLKLPRTASYNNRFLDPKYKEAVWGFGGTGEYWRSRAYFWNVAWPQHKTYHEHIDKRLASINSKGTLKGMDVRPEDVVSLEDTLMWASEIVGTKLGRRLLLDYYIEKGGIV